MGTAAHVSGMSEHCYAIARELGMEPERCNLLRAASPMHDVGKVGVPDRILLKPAALTHGERAEMQRHAEIGYRILAGSRAELLQLAATIAWTHHERIDGSGYPRGLAGGDIPLEGRTGLRSNGRLGRNLPRLGALGLGERDGEEALDKRGRHLAAIDPVG